MQSNKAKSLIVCVVVALLLSSAPPPVAGEHAVEGTTSPAIRITPPAPVFDEKTRLAELAGRRDRVVQSMGPNSMLVLFSAEPRVYTNDVDYLFRQENNLYYLTNLKQKGATVVLLPGNDILPQVLFLPRRNSAAETWTGHMYSAEEASAVSGIKEIWEASEFEPFLQALRNRQPYRPKAENILMSASVAQVATAGHSGFEGLFTAAGKNEGQLYMLI
ncbi:MAG: aminopeptidase P N-terminal domain-containing protein, partial [Pyrinomonadaceae bacterium]